MLEKIKEIMENTDYMYYGLRCDDKLYSVGDICEKSYQWWQDEPGSDDCEYNSFLGLWKGEQLEGTCGVHIYNDEDIEFALDRVLKVYCYAKHLYLIGSDWMYNGEDAYEGIFEDGEVLAILQ